MLSCGTHHRANKGTKDVLEGTQLGDGYMRRPKVTHNPSLAIDQTYPKHEEHVFYLYDIFKNLTLSPPKVSVRNPDKRTGKVYSSMLFITRALPCLIPYFELFYVPSANGGHIKTVPKNIHEFLTAQGLAQ